MWYRASHGAVGRGCARLLKTGVSGSISQSERPWESWGALLRLACLFSDCLAGASKQWPGGHMVMSGINRSGWLFCDVSRREA